MEMQENWEMMIIDVQSRAIKATNWHFNRTIEIRDLGYNTIVSVDGNV